MKLALLFAFVGLGVVICFPSEETEKAHATTEEKPTSIANSTVDTSELSSNSTIPVVVSDLSGNVTTTLDVKSASNETVPLSNVTKKPDDDEDDDEDDKKVVTTSLPTSSLPSTTK